MSLIWRDFYFPSVTGLLPCGQFISATGDFSTGSVVGESVAANSAGCSSLSLISRQQGWGLA
jgi:hypothetical protein